MNGTEPSAMTFGITKMPLLSVDSLNTLHMVSCMCILFEIQLFNVS